MAGPAYSHDTIKKFENEPDSYLQFRLEIEKKLAHGFKGLWANSDAAKEFTQNAKQHMNDKINDRQTLKALLPTKYKAGCRRFTPADKYLEALNQSNSYGQRMGATRVTWQQQSLASPTFSVCALAHDIKERQRN
ncbi:uncharacterized protein FFFS_15869 [Fusarium fujikuroi]|nr:uncharacterized protein FFFS_15869 [Fusarium fujikuroi]